MQPNARSDRAPDDRDEGLSRVQNHLDQERPRLEAGLECIRKRANGRDTPRLDPQAARHGHPVDGRMIEAQHVERRRTRIAGSDSRQLPHRIA